MWHHNPEDRNLHNNIPWQCSRVETLTPECEETNLSVFLLLTVVHVIIPPFKVYRHFVSHIIQVSTSQITHMILVQLLSQKHYVRKDGMNLPMVLKCAGHFDMDHMKHNMLNLCSYS
jgi:hypothetical protein